MLQGELIQRILLEDRHADIPSIIRSLKATVYIGLKYDESAKQSAFRWYDMSDKEKANQRRALDYFDSL